jgi:hypothetical protein
MTASPTTQNYKPTIAPAQSTLSALENVRNDDYATSAISAENMDESATSVSSAPQFPATTTPLETLAKEGPVPNAPVVLTANESPSVVEARSIRDEAAQVSVAQSAEIDSAAPINLLSTVAPAPIEDASQSTKLPVEPNDAGGSATTALNSAAIGDTNNVVKAVQVAYEAPADDSGRNGSLAGDPQPEIAQAAVTAQKPTAAIAVLEQATPIHPVTQGSDAKAGAAIVGLDSTAPASPQSGISSNPSDSSNTAVQSTEVILNPAQSPTELWVGMHSGIVRSNVWSPAGFTSTATGTESSANTSTAAQPLAVQATLSGTASLVTSTNYFAQPVNAATTAGSKTVAGSAKTNRPGSQQQSTQPAAVSGETVAATVAVPVPVQQIVPVESIVSASSTPDASEAIREKFMDTSAVALSSQAQPTPDALPASQSVTGQTPTTNTATTSNGAAGGNDAVASNPAEFSLQALGFTPQLAADDSSLPVGIVPATVSADTGLASQPAPKQVDAAADGTGASSSAFSSARASKSESAPTQAIPALSNSFSTLSQSSTQPVQPSQSFVPQLSATGSKTQDSKVGIRPLASGLAPQLKADIFDPGTGLTTGFTDQPSQTSAIPQPASVNGSNAFTLSARTDEVANGFAQSANASNGGQAPHPDPSLDLASIPQTDTIAVQAQPAPAQIIPDTSSTLLASSDAPVDSASQSVPEESQTTSSSANNANTAQAQTALAQSVPDTSSTILGFHIDPLSDPTSSSSANDGAIVETSNQSPKPIDAMSETELWVGMHPGQFGNRSTRDSGQSPLPGQIPATLQQTLAGPSTQPEKGFDLPAAVNPTARPSLQQGDSKLPTASDDKASTSLPIPADYTVAASNNNHSDARVHGSPETTADNSVSVGVQGNSHPILKPQGPVDPSTTTATTSARAADTANATNPQVAANSPDATPIQTLGSIPQLSSGIFNLPVILPAATDAATNGGSNQFARKDASKETVSAGGSKVSTPSDTADASSSKTAQAGAGSNAGSSLGSQNGGQSAQHSAPDGSQTAAVISKSPDGAAAGVQSVPMHPASHGAAGATGAPDNNKATASPADRGPDTAASVADGEDSVTRSSLNTSKLMQTMSESEMRVGMHSTEFGNISIRTTVSPQQMLAQISLDHSDLSQAISSHAATIQTKLGNDSGLRTLIEVNQQTASSAGNSGSSPQREQQGFVRSVRADSTAVPVEADVGVIPAALVNTNNGHRLDIRA